MTEPVVVLLCPRRADGGHRDRLWAHTRSFWSQLFPDWPIYEGHHDRGPFNRSAAVNRAAAEAGAWDLAVVIDADVLPDPNGVHWAVAEALQTGGPASGFDCRLNLNQRGTERILQGYRGSWKSFVQSKHPLCNSGALVVRRDLWDKVNGFDEQFVGWGYEDTAFEIALTTTAGLQLAQARADLWHLWHPKSPEHDPRLPGFVANRERRDRYLQAAGDPTALGVLLVEAQEGVVKPVPRPGRATRIPRILHRTVPERTSDEAERFWTDACAMHPGWKALTHRDPLDPAEWPETSALWSKCASGAQKAGLIRLEALWAHGGVYIDSDVELYRPLEPLLPLEGFAGWEDARCAPDAVLGFRPRHPAVAEMLALARQRVELGLGAWDSGPGVTTQILPGREDVLLLPPGSFYPYHYKNKQQDRGKNHATEQPWAFGAHHWAHSWAGR